MPPLAALLADTTLQVLGDHRPALGSVLLDQLDHLARRKQERSTGRVKKKEGATTGRRGREAGGMKSGVKRLQVEETRTRRQENLC